MENTSKKPTKIFDFNAIKAEKTGSYSSIYNPPSPTTVGSLALQQQTDPIANSSKRERQTSVKTAHIEVQPIIGDDILRIKEYLLNRPQRYNTIDFNLRDYALFCISINFGLRITDFLTLKIKQLFENGQIIDTLRIRETKNKAWRYIPILPEVKEILTKYLDSIGDWQPDWYLFFPIWPKADPYKVMTRQNIWKKMKTIESELDFKLPLGTHSLRKTFARRIYDILIQTDPMALNVVQKMLGHSSPGITLVYIGLHREMLYNKRVEVGYI